MKKKKKKTFLTEGTSIHLEQAPNTITIIISIYNYINFWSLSVEKPTRLTPNLPFHDTLDRRRFLR